MVVTGTAERITELAARIEVLGGRAFAFVTSSIGPPPDWNALDAAIARLETFRWVVFTSRFAVESFFSRLSAAGRGPREVQGCVVAVGPATARALARHGREADRIPEPHTAEAAAALILASNSRGPVLFPRGDRAREVLIQWLGAAGIAVEAPIVYLNEDTSSDPAPLHERLSSRQVDWIVVTAPSAVRVLAERIGREALASVPFAALGPTTAEAVRSEGWHVAAEAPDQTIEGLVRALISPGAAG